MLSVKKVREMDGRPGGRMPSVETMGAMESKMSLGGFNVRCGRGSAANLLRIPGGGSDDLV